MEEVIQSIVAVGGFGYLNYWLSSRIFDIDIGSDRDEVFIIGFMTSVNYCFYWILSHFFKEPYFRLGFTILCAILFSIIFPLMLRVLYQFINTIRKVSQSSELRPLLLKDMMFNDDKNYCFVFDFDGHIISKGAMAAISGKNESFSLILYPFFESHEEYSISSEEELHHYFEEKNIEARVLLDFDKKLKIIYFSLEDE